MFVVEIKEKEWYLICPVCGWFAGFGSHYDPETPPGGIRGKVCRDCKTELIWDGLERSLENLIWELRFQDPNASHKCGNGWSGFTSKLALTAIRSENDIEWWRDGTSKIR